MSEDRAGRVYPLRPFVGVGAVVLRDGYVLLEQRGQPPALGSWSIPGGLIELGELAEEAVVREVLEETGLTVRLGPLLGLFQPIQRDEAGRVRYHYVVLDFLAHYESGTLRVGDDAADLRWVHPTQLDDYQLTPEARRMIECAMAGSTPSAG